MPGRDAILPTKIGVQPRGSRIRIVDVLFVQKDKHGSTENTMHLTDLSEAERMRLGCAPSVLIEKEAAEEALAAVLAVVETEAQAG